VCVLVILCAVVGLQGLTLTDSYAGTTFFDHWNFYNSPDPTHGYVYYSTYQQAQQWGLIKTTPNNVYIGADHTTVSTGSGRASVRITSKKSFNSGLFVIDLSHMPEGCGTWPAFWLVGPSWPSRGEVDIIEGVNTQTADQTTLHTSNGCDMSTVSTRTFTGHWSTGTHGNPATNCYIHAPNQGSNQGCGIISGEGTYGAPLNAASGGVFATYWTDAGIKTWYFARGHIPADLANNKPNPAGWGLPYANFEFGPHCPSSHFGNLEIIINLTFCGDWAGAVFSRMCPGKGTCDAFVKNNPTYFTNAYWLINYVKVFQ